MQAHLRKGDTAKERLDKIRKNLTGRMVKLEVEIAECQTAIMIKQHTLDDLRKRLANLQ